MLRLSFNKKKFFSEETGKYDTNHSCVKTPLFLDFLSEFRFVQKSSPLGLSKNINPNDFKGQDKLDEYDELVSQMNKPSLKDATMFARFLENYSKSFKNSSAEPTIYDFLQNQLENPVLATTASSVSNSSEKPSKPWSIKPGKEKKKSSSDLLIEQNKMKKYEEAKKKDEAMLTSLKERVNSSHGIKKLTNLVLSNLNVCKTNSVKLAIFEIYLDLQLEWFKSSMSVCDKRKLALDYYKACESSLRVFRDIELEKRFIKNFKDTILKGIEFKLTQNHRRDFINFQLTDAEFCLYQENFR